jgi:hypothetical protein
MKGVRVLHQQPCDPLSAEVLARVEALHSDREIVLSFDYPPIPVRDFDWSACDWNTYEPGAPLGRGPTAEAALADLLDILEEEEAERAS